MAVCDPATPPPDPQPGAASGRGHAGRGAGAQAHLGRDVRSLNGSRTSTAVRSLTYRDSLSPALAVARRTQYPIRGTRLKHREPYAECDVAALMRNYLTRRQIVIAGISLAILAVLY